MIEEYNRLIHVGQWQLHSALALFSVFFLLSFSKKHRFLFHAIQALEFFLKFSIASPLSCLSDNILSLGFHKDKPLVEKKHTCIIKLFLNF